MKIHMFGKPQPAQNPAAPLGVNYAAGVRRASVFRRWLVILLVLLSPLLFSLAWAFYQLAIIGAPGEVKPYETLVRSGVSGNIDSLYVQEGHSVRAGDTLAKLRNPEWEELFMLSEPSGTPIPALRNLPRLQSIQQEKVERLRATYQRLQALDTSRSVTRLELDRAWLEMKDAEFLMEQLRSEAFMAQASRQSGAKQDAQQKAEYENRLRIAEHRYRQQWVTAPDSGRVLSLYVKKGEYGEAGQRLFRIARTSQIKYEAWFEPRHLEYAVPGRLCKMVFPDRQSYPAVISGEPRIDTDFQTREGRTVNPLLKVDIKPLEPIPDRYLLSGMPFQLRIDALLSDMEKNRFLQLLGRNAKANP